MQTLEQKVAESKANTRRLEEKLRKQETGQKIILGGALASAAENNPRFAQIAIELLEGLTRDIDIKRMASFREKLKAGQAKGGSAGKSEPSEAQDAPARTAFRDLV